MGKRPEKITTDMPKLADFLQAVRATFGGKFLSQQIRRGMEGGSDFWARDGEYEIGHQAGGPSGSYNAKKLLDAARPERDKTEKK